MKNLTCILMCLVTLPTWADPVSPQMTLLHQVSFHEDWSRYPSPDVIVKRFRSLFKDNTGYQSYRDECTSLSDTNRSILGDSIPITGAPAMDQPGETFANWYVKCLANFISDEKDDESFSINQAMITQRFGAKAITDCEANDADTKEDRKIIPNNDYSSCLWSSLSPEAKAQMVKIYTLKFIGPAAVVVDLGIAKSEDQLVADIVREVDAFSAKPDARFAALRIDGSGTGVRLRSAKSIIEFLVNLEDILKY